MVTLTITGAVEMNEATITIAAGMDSAVAPFGGGVRNSPLPPLPRRPGGEGVSLWGRGSDPRGQAVSRRLEQRVVPAPGGPRIVLRLPVPCPDHASLRERRSATGAGARPRLGSGLPGRHRDARDGCAGELRTRVGEEEEDPEGMVAGRPAR